MSIQLIDYRDPDFISKVRTLRELLRGGELVAAGTPGDVNVRRVVEEAIEGVKRDGDRFIAEETNRLHGVSLKPDGLRVPEREIEKAYSDFENNDPDFLRLMRRVIANIREYQESILLKAPPSLKRGARELGVRYTPIRRVAVYVPGGKAAYPSSALMTVVPGRVAGVEEIVMVSPPMRDGGIGGMILALGRELEITEIYRVSGVAGLGGVALGTESIVPVDKIVGPGSAFITEAKRQLFGRVGIDSIAGPSEVLIVADDTARADWVAADLLAQTEHDPGSAVLVTPSEDLAGQVAEQLESQMGELDRADAARAALQAYSAVIVTPDLEAACDLANDFAPEHLQVITADDETALGKIRNAGAIFLGAHTPVPLGDYYAGPSHVLPTGGTARFFGPLSCNDFLKGSSTVRYDADSLAADAADVADFATREGLTAHARAVTIRKDQ